MEVTNDEDENDEKKLMSVPADGRAHKKPKQIYVATSRNTTD
jgi:hypothetical protein